MGGAAFGGELRRRRVARGLSLTAFAALVNYSKSHLSKVERGGKAPSPALARLCDAALGAEGALLALMPANAVATDSDHGPGEALPSVWLLRLPEGGPPEFTSACPGDPIRTRFAAGPGTPVGPGDVAGHAALFETVTRLGRSQAPAAVLTHTIAQTHTLRTAAARVHGRTRRDLLRLAARTAEFTGWMAQEAGDEAATLWWTERAVELAAECGDRELAEYADVRRALLALYQGRAEQTVRLAGRVRAAHDLSPRVRWLAALREAQGHALAGSAVRTEAVLEEARKLRSRVDREAAPHTPGHLGTAVPGVVMTELVRGWCLYDLGRPAEAADLLGTLSPHMAGQGRRSRIRFEVRRALALADDGAATAACSVVEPLLPGIRAIESATVRSDLRSLAHTLRRRRSDPAIAAIWPRLLDV